MEPESVVAGQVGTYVADLVERTDRIRLPGLFLHPCSDLEYQLADRYGLSVVALRTDRLDPAELDDILAFRLGNYLSAGLIDPARVFRERLERDPTSSVSPDDVHIVAGARETGRLVAYLALRAADARSTAVLADRDRPLFPVEQAYGPDIFRHRPLLRDLSIARVVELSRYLKNHQLGASTEMAVRGPVEVGVALFRLLCDSARGRWTALVGDCEERVAKRNLDFFQFPSVVIRESTPIVGDDGFLGWAARTRAFVPFAALVADIAMQRDRIASIEQALELAGAEAIRALVALRASTRVPKSGLDLHPVVV